MQTSTYLLIGCWIMPKVSKVASHFSYYPKKFNPSATAKNLVIVWFRKPSFLSDRVSIIALLTSSEHFPTKIKPNDRAAYTDNS